MSVPASNGSNASDLGLIVQGVLIFLSAIVGVIGYVVQSKLSQRAKTREEELARKEHGRQLKLQRVRQQMSQHIQIELWLNVQELKSFLLRGWKVLRMMIGIKNRMIKYRKNDNGFHRI